MNYQLLPEMNEEQYAALKADIKDRGVMIPLEYDENGNLLDGHHRLRVCMELGITDIPKIVRHFNTEEEKRYHIRAVNAIRRQLTQEQMRQIIAKQLEDAPQRSNRQIAAELGVSHHTVGAKRQELESIGQIAQCDRETSDGRIYPAQRKELESRGQIDHVEKTVEPEPVEEIDEDQITIEEDVPEEDVSKETENDDLPTRTKVLDMVAYQKRQGEKEYDKYMDGDKKFNQLEKAVGQVLKLDFTTEDITAIIHWHNDPVIGTIQPIDETMNDIRYAIKILQDINFKLQEKGNNHVKKRF